MASEEQITLAFNTWDKDKNGFIDAPEVAEVLKLAGIPANKVDAMAADLLAKTDTNKDGKISFQEFKAALATSAFRIPK